MTVELSSETKIYIAGHKGLVGSAIWRYLQSRGIGKLIGWTSSELDLRDREPVLRAIAEANPDVVILAAAKVGGIMANANYPVEFLQSNLRIQTNIFEAAQEADVEQVLFLGSSCIYPKLAPQPIQESSLLTGPLEPTNDAYAIAKIAGVLAIQAYRREYGRHWISAMPTNLYGPGDNFGLQNSHVLPAMMRRFHEAREAGAERIELWGTGTPMREFLHVDDLASAAVFLLENYDSPDPINVGVGRDATIRELAELMASTVGYEGELDWDTSKPDGTPRKLLDVSKLHELGWSDTIPLTEGVAATYEWFLANQGELRDR